MSDDDSIFSRWSKRKRGLEAEPAVAKPVEAQPVAAEPEPEPESEEAETALLERLQLPRPETLKPGDDFSAFMRTGVPEFLRKRALRVLWRSNPVLANLDGLNDYDDDFTSPELNKKIIATAYKVGRGIAWEQPEPVILQENDKEQLRGEALESEIDGGNAVSEGPGHEVAPEIAELPRDEGDDPENSFRPKRMRFRT